MSNSYRFERYEVCPARRQLLAEGRVLPLGSRAFDLLIGLIEHSPRLVTKAELLDIVWPGLVVEEHNIQVQVSALRKALGSNVIATVPGLGYRFAAEVDLRADPIPHAGNEMPDFARSQSPAAAASTVPVALDTLVGRDDDIGELVALVRACRLVSILGPGGIGKTRLAQEVARLLSAEMPGGICWVDLAAIGVGGDIPAAVANAANLHVGGDGSDILARVVGHLQARRALLVLDNCEHLADGVAEFARAASSRAPLLHLLVTSQKALHVTGGVNYGLLPLRCPARADSLAQARSTGSIQLLERRATAADRRFQLTDSNLAQAIDLVTRLDGMPLAIEMAASRIPLLGLDALNVRLHERFELLRHVEQQRLPRHQTLLATLEWSDSLLDEAERRVLRRLSVFVGSIRLEAVLIAVVEGDEIAALDAIGTLVDRSLLQVDAIDPPRYRLLETVRLFGLAQLRRHGHEEDARLRHGQAMTSVGREIEARYWDLPDAALLHAYSRDYDDLQCAFERACERSDALCAAVTACALMRLDVFRGLTAPRKARAERLHALLTCADAEALSWIWTAMTAHGLIALDAISRIDAAARAVAAARAQPDPLRLHQALGFQACEGARIHDFDLARRCTAEACALLRPEWPTRRRMWHAAVLASVASYSGDAAAYRAGTREEIELAELAGADRSAAWARLKLADAALMAGDLDESIALGRAVSAQLRELDQPANFGLAQTNLCAALLLRGDLAAGRACAIEAMAPMWGNGWAYMLLDSVALIAAIDGSSAEAAQLLGYVDDWYRRHVDTRQPNEATLRSRTLESMPPQSSAALAQWLLDGTRMSDREAQGLARRILGMSPGHD